MLQRRIMKCSTRRIHLICSIVAQPWIMIFILIDSVLFYKDKRNCGGNDWSVCNSSCCQLLNSFWIVHLIIWNLLVLVNICGITTSQLPYRSETNGSSENAVRKLKEGISALLVQSCLSKNQNLIPRCFQEERSEFWRRCDRRFDHRWLEPHRQLRRVRSSHEKVQLQRWSNLGVCVYLLMGVYILNMHLYQKGVCVSLPWSLSLSRLVFVSVSLGVRLGVSCSCVTSLSVCVISLSVRVMCLSVCVISLSFCAFTLCVCVFFLCVCVYISRRYFLSLLMLVSLFLDVGLSLDWALSLWYWNFLIWASSVAHHIYIVHHRTPRTLLFSVARITIAFTFLCGVGNL